MARDGIDTNTTLTQSGPKLRVSLHARYLERFPLPDAVLIGRRAAIGPEAARRVADALAPGKFELVHVADARSPIEAVLIHKAHTTPLPARELVGLLLEESRTMLTEDSIVLIELNLELQAERSLQR